MKYDGSLQYNDYDIEFTFDLSDEHDGLLLNDWTAYLNDVETAIPCRVEVEYIEKLIEEQLANKWGREGYNYIQAYRDYMADKMHDYYEDR